MNKNTWTIVGLVALVLVGGAVYSSMNKKDGAMMAQDDMVLKTTETQMTAEQSIMKDTASKMMNEKESEMPAQAAGSYQAYNQSLLSKAETGDVVLFFHASWCPSCRSLNTSIESNLSSIPANVTILKTDYDKETDLKKKYGITYQHTMVQVDKDGNLIKKWSGSPNLASLLSQIQ